MAAVDSYRVAAVVGAEIGRGFALAGVELLAATTPEGALELLREAVRSRRWGILIVDEALLGGIDERERSSLLESTLPLVIVLPATMRWRDAEARSSEELVASLIRRAVGYELNIQV